MCPAKLFCQRMLTDACAERQTETKEHGYKEHITVRICMVCKRWTLTKVLLATLALNFVLHFWYRNVDRTAHLTNSMEISLSIEVDTSLAYQGLHCVLINAGISYRVEENPPLDIIFWINWIQCTLSHTLSSGSILMLSSVNIKCLKLSLALKYYHKIVCVFSIYCMFTTCPAHYILL